MRMWQYTLADGRTAIQNTRHAAVTWIEHDLTGAATGTEVQYAQLLAERYGADCPDSGCWCQADAQLARVGRGQVAA